MNEYSWLFFSMALSMCGDRETVLLTMFLLMFQTKRVWIGRIGRAGKERHTNTQKGRHRYGHTQAHKSEHSFTVRVVWPYLSPSHSETYASAAVKGWCTPRQPLLPFNIHQRARLGQPTSLTFIGPSDSIVHHIVITYIGLTTVYVCVWGVRAYWV